MAPGVTTQDTSRTTSAPRHHIEPPTMPPPSCCPPPASQPPAPGGVPQSCWTVESIPPLCRTPAALHIALIGPSCAPERLPSCATDGGVPYALRLGLHPTPPFPHGVPGPTSCEDLHRLGGHLVSSGYWQLAISHAIDYIGRKFVRGSVGTEPTVYLRVSAA